MTERSVFDSSGEFIFDSTGFWFFHPDSRILKPFNVGYEPVGFGEAAWSPDAKWLALDYGGIIRRYKSDKTVDEVLVDTLEGARSPAWSPNGQSIAFAVSDGPDRLRGLWRVNVETREIQEFEHPVLDKRCINCHGLDRWMVQHPDWSTGGTEIAYVAFEDQIGFVHLAVYEIQTADVRIVHSSSIGIEDPKFSPDGETIVFSTRSDKNQLAEIWTISSDGSDLQKLASGAWQPTWSPDGRQLMYVKFSYDNLEDLDNGMLFMMNANGSKKKQLTFRSEGGGLD